MKIRLLPKNFKLNTSYIIKFVILTVVYVVAGKLGLKLALDNPSATAVWAPSGIAVASLILFGYEYYPAILLGAFLTNVTTAGTIVTSGGIAIGNTLEALSAAYLINIYADGKNVFKKTSNVFLFTVLAGFVSTAVSATIGTTTLLLGGLTNLQLYGSVWSTWWLGDASGVLIVAPLIILWAVYGISSIKASKIAEFIALLLILILICEFVFTNTLHLTYLIIPILLWAAIRLGSRQSITAVFFVSVIATISTLSKTGPFYTDGGNLSRSLLLLQQYLGTISVMILIISSVVHERKSNQEQLENSEKRFKALIEKSVDAISLIDDKGTTLYTGPSTENVLGFTSEELNGTNAFDLIHPEDLAYTTKVFGMLLKNPGGSEGAEFRLKKKDGSWCWVEATGTNLLNNKAVGAIVINYRDITERKYIEETVEREKAEDEALIQNIGEGIIATNNEGKIVLVNKACEDLLKFKEKDLLDKKTEDVLKMLDENGKPLKLSERPLVKALKTKMKITATHFLVRSDKTQFPASIVATPVILNGETIGAIKVFRDITQEKLMDQAKTEFVSFASHQLRTPLSTINWYIEMLTDKHLGPLNEKQKDYLNEVYTASQRMVALTNALLTVSKLELGKIEFKPENINLADEVDEVIKEIKPRIDAKKLTIEKAYQDKSEDFSLNNDPKLINMILLNILSNSVKYTEPEGKIKIKLDSSQDSLNIAIEDDGYGIPTEEQDKIFTKLFRASNVKDIEQYGSGLGLYIVKTVTEQIGGKITFKSPPEGSKKGTGFYITIPKNVKVKSVKLAQAIKT